MSFGYSTIFRKPRKPKAVSERKAIRPVGRKGEFWAFCAEIIRRSQRVFQIPEACEVQGPACDGRNLTWAHTTRRWTIRAKQYDEDWWHALRVLRACAACHYDADSQGGPAAEEILEPIVKDRFKRMELNNGQVKQVLGEIATKIQTEQPEPKEGEEKRFSQFEVRFD